MYIAEGVDHDTRASMLVRSLIDEHDPKFGVGSMTCSIYDTAWVSMVAKTSDGQTKWLFPWSFHYLLGHQQHDGGWATSGSDGNAILNTLAALLALCKHMAAPHQLIYIPQEELKHKKDRAIYFLEAKFSQWDVSLTSTKNFEILIPKMLQLLEVENIEFAFPGRQLLNQLNAKATAKINPSTLYGNVRSTATQYLEGFLGELDFDRVSQHKICGSMMASPASTAAYLMNCSKWDNESEEYLSHVVSIGDEDLNGGVPSLFPSTVFELATTVSVLLENGFSATDLSIPHLDSAASFLEDCLALESGVTGFAPYVESDADNTARAISTLSLLGRTCLPQGMIIRYETREFFKTYTQDRNPSFRTNCLVLKALLDLMPQNREVTAQIEKTVKFVANYWWTTNGHIKDSTNTSPHFTTMLMSDAFTRLIELRDQRLVPTLDDPIFKDKVFLCLFQALTRTLQTQNSDGSWGTGLRSETTAYALLTLIRLSSLSSAPRVKLQLGQAIDKARSFLSKSFHPNQGPEQLWKEKSLSGSRILSQAYVLAAQRATAKQALPGKSIENRFGIPIAKIAIQTKYYGRQPWFMDVPEWLIQAFLVEGRLFLPQLKDVRYAVFPREVLAEDTCFDSIPFAWAAAGSVDRRLIAPEYLYQMMILTFLTRQYEQYAKNVLGVVFEGCLFEIEDVIHQIFEELETVDSRDQCFCGDHGNGHHGSSISTTGTVSLSEARSVLYRYISHVMNHPYVLMASHHDQDQLRSELLAFMLSRICSSTDDNSNLGVEEGALAKTTGSSSPDQTSHQLAFAFLCCMVGKQTSDGAVGLRRDFLDSPEQHYLVADLCRRLSILSFLSDAGPGATSEGLTSERRASLRSSSVGESHRHSFQSSMSSASATSSSYSDNSSPVSPVSSVSSAPASPSSLGTPMKTATHRALQSEPQDVEQASQLKRLLWHERKCLDTCLESLTEASTNDRTLNILKLFVDVSELSEQIFSDPNVGTYHANVDHQVLEKPQKTEQVHLADPPPPPAPPKKVERRGSVSAARAALEVAPLQPRRESRERNTHEQLRSQSSDCLSRTPSISTATDTPSRPSQDDIKLKGTTNTQREWNFNKANKIMQNRKASQSSIEISRIERIMADIDGGKSTDASLPTHPALRNKKAADLPKPKINPMLPYHPDAKLGKPLPAQERSKYEPIMAHGQTNGKARSSSDPKASEKSKSSRDLIGSIRRKKSEIRLPPAKEAEEQQFRRASLLQARAMVEAANANTSVQTRPSLSNKGEDRSNKAAKKSKSEDKARSLKLGKACEQQFWSSGWVKAPPPVNNNGEAALEAERVERMKKLKRASRLGGPRWRAPF